MPAGRPTVMTKEVLQKLEEAFAFGATDLEACFYADISKSALYEYQEAHPEFTERKAKLKERPILLARQSVIQHLADDGNLALKFLERKRKKEFGTSVDITSGDEPLTISLVKFVGDDNPDQAE